MVLFVDWGELNGGDLVMVIYRSWDVRVLVFDFFPNWFSADPRPATNDHADPICRPSVNRRQLGKFFH